MSLIFSSAEMFNTGSPEDSCKFIAKLNSFIEEITSTKQSIDPKLWKAEYDIMYDKLIDILDMSYGDIITSMEMFYEMTISKYDSFANYIYNNDINMIKFKKGNNERTKMLRAKRKDILCPECNHPLVKTDSSLLCNSCGYVSDLKCNATNNRSSSDTNKHTNKQLDAITGTKKPPANIVKIINYVSIWLTDLKFIHAWLVSNDKLQSWMKKYHMITDEHISSSYFNKVVPQIPDNMYECDIYKLFTDELYLLLENCKRFSKAPSSNMEALSHEQIVQIFEHYIGIHGKIIPEFDAKIECNGINYEIGLFVNKLSLIYDPPEGSIKPIIDSLFGHSITTPGLMFNFNDIYEQSDNVPKRYNLTQEYIYITHETFNVPYINMTVQDKAVIVNLILQFNDFYKKESYKKCGKECNAPLFCCSLTCVLTQLPYFYKYKDTLRFIPIKDKGTSLHIKSEWFKFACQHKELITPYESITSIPEINDNVMTVVNDVNNDVDDNVDNTCDNERMMLMNEIHMDELLF